QLAHADRRRLGHRHLEAHLVFLEVDDEEFQLVPCDLLILDSDDLADAMRRIDDILARLETLPGRGLFLLVCHTPCTPCYRTRRVARTDLASRTPVARGCDRDRQPGRKATMLANSAL